ASWQVTGLPSGSYTVQATWNASSNHPSNAPYAIYDGTTLVRTVFVDQRPAPSGVVVGGVAFQDLGTVQVTSGTLRVVLSDAGDGYVVADAVRVVPVTLSGGSLSGLSLAPSGSVPSLGQTSTLENWPQHQQRTEGTAHRFSHAAWLSAVEEWSFS